MEAVPSPCSPLQKERLTSQRGASSSGTQRIPLLRAKASITRTKKFVKGLRNIIKMKRTPKAADPDAHRGFDHALDRHVLAAVRQNAEEVSIPPFIDERIRTIIFHPYYPKTVNLEKHDHVTPFLDAALIPRDHCGHLLVYKEAVLHIRNE